MPLTLIGRLEEMVAQYDRTSPHTEENAYA